MIYIAYFLLYIVNQYQQEPYSPKLRIQITVEKERKKLSTNAKKKALRWT